MSEKKIKTYRVKAPAKLNIGLRITGVRDDGYHTLESVFQQISLSDIIDIVYPADKLEIVFGGEYGKGIDSQKNTVRKAYFLLKNMFPSLPPVKITVKKNIPHGSGLGGGSSDGAAVYKSLVSLFSLPVNYKEMEAELVKIGADVPFFVKSPTALVEGIGEIITPIRFLQNYRIVLYFPGFPVSTVTAYKNYDLFLTPNKKNVIFKPLLSRVHEIGDLNNCFYNDLEEVVLKMFPELKRVPQVLKNAGCEYVQMTGSGSCFFGLHYQKINKKRLEELEGNWFFCFPINSLTI